MTHPVGPRLRRTNGRTRQPIAISAGIVILAAVVLVCTSLIVVPLWTAVVKDWQAETISDPCAVKDAIPRQDCLEQLWLGETRHPAKGANAPIRLHRPE
jgi:hypothetical protein